MDTKFCTLFLLVVFLMNLDKFVSSNVQKAKSCAQVDDSLFCSDDCTQVLQCTVVGQDPLVISTCKNGKYCLEDKQNDNASCTAETPQCESSASEDVQCVTRGEFPHPTRCDTTVWCNQDQTLADTCTCTKGFIDITRNNLPCIESADKCPRELVECKTVGEIGQYPGSNDYCYTCWQVDSKEVIQVYFCPTKLNAKSLFFPSLRGKECKPPNPTGGNIR